MAIVYDAKTRLYHIEGKYKDENGKWKDYERFTGKNAFKGEKEAKKADEEFRKKMDKSLPDKLNSQLTVTDLWNLYEDDQRSLLKASTLQNDQDSLRIIPCFEDFKFSTIKEKTIKSVITELTIVALSENEMISAITKFQCACQISICTIFVTLMCHYS